MAWTCSCCSMAGSLPSGRGTGPYERVLDDGLGAARGAWWADLRLRQLDVDPHDERRAPPGQLRDDADAEGHPWRRATQCALRVTGRVKEPEAPAEVEDHPAQAAAGRGSGEHRA